MEPAGLSVYAFDGTKCTGYNGTSETGNVTFTLPMGDYRFRADRNGTQFWSGADSHCTVPGCTSATVTTTVPATVTVLDTASLPQVGLPAYTFNGITYTNFSKTMNSAGQTVFTLPTGDYRFRANEISAPH